MKQNPGPVRGQAGTSLLEVLIGILVFAIGIMALTQLQGSLARSAGDANTRTVAINIAEEAIERRRGFSRVSTDPNGIEYAYADIAPAQYTIARGEFNYNVTIVVTNYWYHYNTQLFTTTEPAVVAASDFKLMTVNVGWGDGAEFMIDTSHSTGDRLGSGDVTLSEIISSTTSTADAKSATGGTGGLYLPSINYNPGSNPEIISISLGDNKFKETTVPLPKVMRTDGLAETTFDVVTYSQNDEGANFLRREEFRAISCNCALQVPVTATQGGLRPAIWNGNDYTRGELVAKPYGSSTSDVQSKLCTICCRDHHDGGVGQDDDPNDPGRSRYNPFRAAADYFTSGSFANDHKHYARNSSGGLTLASADGGDYMEACRMVRKDGFWQVGQDLRQEGLNVFPENYLDSTTEVAEYSGYVTASVGIYESAIDGSNQYELAPPAWTPPDAMNPPVNFPASTSANATTLPTPLGLTTQQLRSRGIYLDYMSDALRAIVDCLQLGGTGEACGAPFITTPLEIIPFYDVQLTWLSRWNETPVNNPVDVSNQAIADNNTHSRGLATRMAGTGLSAVDNKAHKGNLGLTGTDPMDLNYAADLSSRNLYIQAQSTTPPPGLNEYLISGLITSSIAGFKASDVEITYTGAQCNRTHTGFACLVEMGAADPRLTVSNYYSHSQYRLACNSVLVTQSSESGANGYTRFNLPTTATSNANIIIKVNSC